MLVNLFDNTFRHDVCSTAGAVPAHFEYVRDRAEFDGTTIFVDGFIAEPLLASSPVKVGWLHEPPCLIPAVYQAATHWAGYFDFIITYDAELLKLPGFKFMPYAGTWITAKNRYMHPKGALVSMLLGSKQATEGHRSRHIWADAVSNLGVDFFGVRGDPVGYGPAAKMGVLGGYMFSIVGECCRVNNLFTEILLDCFALGTIPVFWGCPNIGRFFDARGILSFETPDECVHVVENLSSKQYRAMFPYAIDNLHTMAEYAVAEDWMYEHILKSYQA